MLRDLKAVLGGERGAAEVTGVSVITLRSTKHRHNVSQSPLTPTMELSSTV